ncbi:tRNA(Met) cytidine acetyltransferase [Enterovibrio nigricans DSM 22720]|uniref:tRNA(Met) cytidine acetyltransferase TmcA n=1 Tax=Enterovibrio nigricans DSM 22720 TaxID=1121868 RepID=A0A1T4VHL1_9GAMM|nr:tRNA(Met) cytidine acetyltransferase [Enterovibrio nigricans DSM 22720]
MEGDSDFCVSLLNALPDVIVVSDATHHASVLPWSKAKQLLGQELGTLALDIRESIDVDKVCAFSGCVKGGELLLFLVTHVYSPFTERLSRFYSHPNAAIFSQKSGVTLPSICTEYDVQTCFSDGVTDDQKMAIDAINKVLNGHRRRPLLMVADRGRGKSSAMGLAAGHIIAERKKRILVTSPSMANVETLFKHAVLDDSFTRESKQNISHSSGGEVCFVAPDALLRELPSCDLLLVDEAAAIPIPMLDNILLAYSRIVFSSTEHGYEGTGRAFSSRFRSMLSTCAKGWKECRLETPVRWSRNDPLEQWLFDAFLFDAEPDNAPECGDITTRQITSDDLLRDEPLLRQLFALMVTAHYQTSPNDLVQLLNSANQIIIGAFNDGVLVGAALGMREGNFEPGLAMDVVLGKRRAKGHLLAQSLASHSGIVDPLVSSLLRIVRIAVHPSIRRQGIGSALISALEQQALQVGIAAIGTSFGCNMPLWAFWTEQGYHAVRLGVQRDAASGSYSLQMIKPLGERLPWIEQLSELLSLNFLHQLSEQYADMDTMLLNRLVSSVCRASPPSLFAKEQIRLFSQGALGYDLVVGSLWQWFLHWLIRSDHHDEMNSTGCLLLSAKLLQRSGWDSLAKKYGYTGRKDAETAMRQWVAIVIND